MCVLPEMLTWYFMARDPVVPGGLPFSNVMKFRCWSMRLMLATRLASLARRPPQRRQPRTRRSSRLFLVHANRMKPPLCHEAAATARRAIACESLPAGTPALPERGERGLRLFEFQ